jgi:uncharacterized membrane protein
VYPTLKFLHILFAIIAVGFTSTFGIIMGRAASAGRDGRELKFALQLLQVMARIAHVAFLVVLVTGIGIVQVVGFPWYAWVKWSMALFAFAFLVGVFVLGPSITKRLRILDERGAGDPEFIAISKRSAMVGMGLSLVTLVILWLMVAKPA